MSKFEKSSGNVFRDLNFSDADQMLAKAEMARQIGKLIKKRGLTQAEAASLLKIDQPKVSALVNGRLAAFSTQRLMRFLKTLGYSAPFSNEPRKPNTLEQLKEGVREHLRKKHARR